MGSQIIVYCEIQQGFCLPGRDRSLLEPRHPLKGSTQKISFVATLMRWKEAEWRRVIEEETRSCHSGEKAKETGVRVPMLSPSHCRCHLFGGGAFFAYSISLTYHLDSLSPPPCAVHTLKRSQLTIPSGIEVWAD